MPASETHPPTVRGPGLSGTAALAAGHAALFAAAFPPLNLWPLAFVAVWPLTALAVRDERPGRTWLVVMAATWLMWLFLHRWIIDVSATGYPFLGLYLSLFPALYVWVVRRISRHGRLQRVPMTVLAPIVWVAVELLRGGLLFDGYPWFLLAHPMVEWPALAQSADLFGTYFLSAIGAATSGLAVDALRVRRRAMAGRAVVACALGLFALHGLNVGYGAWRLGQTDLLRPGPTVLAVQTNLPQSNKIGWSFERQQEDVPGFIALTREGIERERREGRRVDLAVWPETMLPGYGIDLETLRVLNDLADARFRLYPDFYAQLLDLSEQTGAALLIGSPVSAGWSIVEDEGTLTWKAGRRFNSAYLVQGEPPFQRYDKVVLTPFGETMPYISAWPWLERRLLALGAEGMSFDLDVADELRVLMFRWQGREVVLATPICFEDTVASLCRRMIYDDGVKRGDAFVNLSNDGWFGADEAGRRRHAQIARFRCIENRVPMIRCVNTGLSLSIDSCGNVVGRLGAGRYGQGNRPGTLPAELRLDDRRTLYGRIGDVWAWMSLGAAVVLLGLTLLKRQNT